MIGLGASNNQIDYNEILQIFYNNFILLQFLEL